MFRTLQNISFPARQFKNKLHRSPERYQELSLAKDLKYPLEDKMKFWMKKYEDLFGITKLSEMHDRVLENQKNIQDIQDKRRKVQEEIFVAQQKLQEMQDILHKTSMGDSMYISVVTQVHELLRDQKRLRDTFSLYDQTEREYQTSLALAINSSQDHERTYREKNKYLSVITGVVGGLVGVICSSINNWRHRKDIRVFANDISRRVDDLQDSIVGIGAAVPAVNGSTNPTTVLSEIQQTQKDLQDNVKAFQSMLNSEKLIGNVDIHDSELRNRLLELEDSLKYKLNYNASISIGLISSLIIVSTVILFLTNVR